MLKIIWIKLLIVLIVSSFASGKEGLDIYYNLDLYFYPSSSQGNGFIEGVNHIRVVNNSSQKLDAVLIHNPSNGKHRSKDPNSPFTEIGQIRSSHLGEIIGRDSVVIKLILSPPVDVGQTVLIDIPFKTLMSSWHNSTFPTVGAKKDTVVYNGVHFYPVLDYFGDKGWLNPDQETVQSNFSFYKISLTIPDEFEIGSSIKVLKQKTLSTGHIQYTLEEKSVPDFSVVIYRHLNKTSFLVSNMEVEIIAPTNQFVLVNKVKERLEKIIPFYENYFGQTTSDKLVISTGYSLDAPALSLSNYIIFQDKIDAGLILDHEVAHQWFGNSIQTNERKEKWLNESLAEFAGWLFSGVQKNNKIGFKISDPIPRINITDEVKKMSGEDWAKLLREIIGDNSLPPVYEPGKQLQWEDAANIYSQYIVGNHALQILHTTIGDSKMRAIMKDYYYSYRQKSSGTENFIETIQKHTNRNIADNFRLVLTTNLRPDLIIEDVKNSYNKNRTWENRISTTYQGKWILPVDILIVTEKGDSTLLKKVSIEQESVIELTTKSPIVLVEMDPYKRVFDTNRFNNRWPRQIALQPEYGLPKWETYEVYYRPKLKRDWQGNWRAGINFSGGLGINLLPIMPAFYQNLFELEVTFSTGMPSHNWGGRLNYRTPLKSTKNLYWSFETGHEYPKSWSKISLVNYIGETSYLAIHGKSSYSRLTTTLSSTEYTVADSGDWWEKGKNIKLKEEWTLFSYTPNQRYLIQLHALGGFQDKEEFYNIGFSSDYETHRFERIVMRLHGEAGFVWDDRIGDELSYRLLFIPKVWHQREGRIPLFRGVVANENTWNKNIVSFGFSLGLDMDKKIRPLIYMDSAVTHNDSGSLSERLNGLVQSESVYVATGFGLESQTMMEIGFYFPFWVYEPTTKENHFAFRVLMQWGFYF